MSFLKTANVRLTTSVLIIVKTN